MTAAPSLKQRLLVPIPACAGIGLKPAHYRQILDRLPDAGWFEVHAENYMGAGGPPHHFLERVRAHYPLSIHGVGLSLGGAEPLDRRHLGRLRALIDRYEPALFSEHLAWSSHAGAYFGDLLPFPYTPSTLAQVAARVDQLQTAVGRRVLIENPSAYVAFDAASMRETAFLHETAFLAELARRTGCGLLLDVNNVFVSAVNRGFDPTAYIDAFPMEPVGEIHLAGCFETLARAGGPLMIDAHDSAVRKDVWELYARAIRRAGAVPTLIEWDNDVPALEFLLAEARKADGVMNERRSNHARAR